MNGEILAEMPKRKVKRPKRKAKINLFAGCSEIVEIVRRFATKPKIVGGSTPLNELIYYLLIIYQSFKFIAL